MSIYGALYSGVSGLNAQSNALGIISDNISNVNTVGYKGAKASFSTLVTNTVSQTDFTPGGVTSRPLSGIDQQGLLQSSSNATDLAISGNGMFVVNDSVESADGDGFKFTRAGEFRPDREGNLVNSAGLFLQGWPLDDDGNLPAAPQALGSVETVNVSNLSGLPRGTSTMELGANLPSGAANGDTFEATAQIFDALGNAHDLTIGFEKTDVDTWDYTIQQPAGATNITDNTGTLTFNGDGSPDEDADVNPTPTITWANNAADSTIDIDLGSQDGFDGVTNFATDFTGFTELNQNGLKFGNFTGVSVDDAGTVTAVFDNGRQKDIYQLPVAQFNNPNGLRAESGNAYQQTEGSGDVLLNASGTGGAGTITPSALEGSTVDLGEEFTNMITTQRAYSAATKVITTSDEMLQELTQAIR